MKELLDSGFVSNQKEAFIALQMFVMSGCMAFQGMHTLGAENEIVMSAFNAWMQTGSKMFGEELFCVAVSKELGELRGVLYEIDGLTQNTLVQC